MAVTRFDTEWTKTHTAKSIFLFFVHFLILISIMAATVFWEYLGDRGALEALLREHGADYIYALFCTVMLVLIMYLYFFFEARKLLSTNKNIALLFAVLELAFLASWVVGRYFGIFARPVAFTALMIFALVGRREAVFMNIVSALMIFFVDTFAGGATVDQTYYSSLLIAVSAGMMAIFLANKAKSRLAVVAVGIILVFPIDASIFFLRLTDFVNNIDGGLSAMRDIIMDMGYGLLGGVISAVMFLAILPFFEVFFNCLTVYRLRELCSSDAKLLKRLKEEAPGTYNHSMTVAQLAEACAAAIGEDPDCARAAALYHDLGKTHYPEHFTENQGEYNVHDELTPELSADIIRSHAMDGYNVIKANHLPDFLADVAREHHGTLPIRYFYAKALKMTDAELNIEDFSYMGPKPQSKLAAIIMIADASEAAVRAVNARNPEQAEKAIRGIIEERMDLEQFSECDITMVDLTKIRMALVNTLSGVYHHRVKYPSIKYKRTESGETKGENV